VPLGGAAHPARLSTLPPLRLRETPSETPLHEHPTRLPPTRRVGNVLSLSPTASGVFPSSSRTIVYTSSSVCSVRPTKSTCSSWPVAVHVFSGHTCRAISAGDQRGLTPGVLPRNRRAATSGSCANVSSVTCDSHARTYLPPLLTSVALIITAASLTGAHTPIRLSRQSSLVEIYRGRAAPHPRRRSPATHLRPREL
jgi:hypothetical protein